MAKIEKVLLRFLIFVMVFTFHNTVIAQIIETAPRAEKTQKATEGIKKIRRTIKDRFANSPVRPDYPIQNYYQPPTGRTTARLFSAVNDTTPPNAPTELTVVTESIHSIFASWTAATDPESGIDYYAYGIGSQPGAADIRWWQSTGQQTGAYGLSLDMLGIAEDSTFYISIYAVNGAGLQSVIVSSGSTVVNWQDLGNQNNALTVAYSDFGYDSTGVNIISGWDSTEMQMFDHFISRMNPIIKEIYGPPSHSYTVTLVKNLWYAGSNIFFPSSNQVHMSEMYPQLLTHELIHAYRDNVILSTNDNWQFHPHLSGFEESFAQGASYACMNRYIELYPNDVIVDSTYLFGSSMLWDYDYRNVPAITTEDFWSDYGGIGLFWERYELGAAAMRKIHVEDPDFYHKFNTEYYHRLNQDHSLTTRRDLMIEIIAKVVPEIEMQPAKVWINNQRIFDCQVVPGRKIWVWTQRYPWQEYLVFQRIFFYETFENGSEWAYWDENNQTWVYHHLNGSIGTGTVTTYGDSAIWQGSLQIEPVDNPPDFWGFGFDELNFSTDDDLMPWPGGSPSDFLLGMHDFNLYRFNLNFGGITEQVHRIIGDNLRNPAGVFGGILNAQDGVIYLDHENYPPEPPLPVVNGVFYGTRKWASVPNPRTGGTDSQPGRIHVRFVQNDGRHFLAQRNIDWGSANGNQVFLFDTEAMQLDTNLVSSAEFQRQTFEFRLQQNYPNPFNPTTEIRYTLALSGRVELVIFNLLGQRVKTLVSAQQSRGHHIVKWNGADDHGRLVSSGVYFYLLKSGAFRTVKKLLLVR